MSERCESCGLEKESTKPVVDPFMLLVWNEKKLRLLCDHCFDRRMAAV